MLLCRVGCWSLKFIGWVMSILILMECNWGRCCGWLNCLLGVSVKELIFVMVKGFLLVCGYGNWNFQLSASICWWVRNAFTYDDDACGLSTRLSPIMAMFMVQYAFSYAFIFTYLSDFPKNSISFCLCLQVFVFCWFWSDYTCSDRCSRFHTSLALARTFSTYSK